MPIPAHVPPALIYDFDHFSSPEVVRDPHFATARRLHGEAPPIFYSPRNGGLWLVTRSEIGLEILRQTDKFSNNPVFNRAKLFDPPMLPVQSDPPEHTEFRRILNPKLTPGSVNALEPGIRECVREIIDEIRANGGCEFVEEVGERFSVTLFLKLAGAPLSDRAELVRMAIKYTKSPDFNDRQDAMTELAAYLQAKYRNRQVHPVDDMLTQLATAKLSFRELTESERSGLGVMLFLAGLDTVKSLLSFFVAYLAKHPAQYKRITDNPAVIPAAMEELLRVHGIVTLERGATHDFEYRGVQFRRGDRIALLTQVFGLDDQAVDNPYVVDFDRRISPHLIFGAGPHRCIGSHLARIEIRVFLEEWCKAFPLFGLKDNAEVKTAGGVVWAPTELPVVWPI